MFISVVVACIRQKFHSLGNTCLSAYTLKFQTNLFSILPPTFPPTFKSLCASTLPSSDPDAKINIASSEQFWNAAEMLGLMDRYDSIIASVGYEHIEAHVLSTCAGQWAKPVLADLKNWMADKMIPWMLVTYARHAQTSSYFVHLFSFNTYGRFFSQRKKYGICYKGLALASSFT